jgi:hypothetical protein
MYTIDVYALTSANLNFFIAFPDGEQEANKRVSHGFVTKSRFPAQLPSWR